MTVEIGSVWDDADPRAAGRTVEVMDFVGTHAVVRLNTVAPDVGRQSIGRRTRVRLDRFGSDYRPSDTPPHRFGRHADTGELGYWPKGSIGVASGA